MKGRVRWDEANLDEINTNKPIRKKIDEPKTPYHPILAEDGCSDSSDSISYAAHAEAVRIALNEVALTQNHSSQFGDAMDKEEASVKEPRAIKFEEHRRAHYDEIKKMKELKQKNSLLDYEDLDDYSNHEGICNASPSQPSGIKEIYIHSDDEILKTLNIDGNS